MYLNSSQFEVLGSRIAMRSIPWDMRSLTSCPASSISRVTFNTSSVNDIFSSSDRVISSRFFTYMYEQDHDTIINPILSLSVSLSVCMCVLGNYLRTSLGTTIPQSWKGLAASFSTNMAARSSSWVASWREEWFWFMLGKMGVICIIPYLFLVHLPRDLTWRRRWLLSKESAGHVTITWEVRKIVHIQIRLCMCMNIMHMHAYSRLCSSLL